jgi:hypothetical protein
MITFTSFLCLEKQSGVVYHGSIDWSRYRYITHGGVGEEGRLLAAVLEAATYRGAIYRRLEI